MSTVTRLHMSVYPAQLHTDTLVLAAWLLCEIDVITGINELGFHKKMGPYNNSLDFFGRLTICKCEPIK